MVLSLFKKRDELRKKKESRGIFHVGIERGKGARRSMRERRKKTRGAESTIIS